MKQERPLVSLATSLLLVIASSSSVQCLFMGTATNAFPPAGARAGPARPAGPDGDHSEPALLGLGRIRRRHACARHCHCHCHCSLAARGLGTARRDRTGTARSSYGESEPRRVTEARMHVLLYVCHALHRSASDRSQAGRSEGQRRCQCNAFQFMRSPAGQRSVSHLCSPLTYMPQRDDRICSMLVFESPALSPPCSKVESTHTQGERESGVRSVRTLRQVAHP